MKLLVTPQMQVGKMQMFAEKVLEYCGPHEEVKKPLAAVKTQFDKYREGMRKNPALAKFKRERDKIRDTYVIGFVGALDAELHYPYSNEERETLLKIEETIDKYGDRIYRLPYDSETASLDNLLTDIEKLDLSVLKNDAVTKWFPVLKEANQQFKDSDSDYLDDLVDAAQIKAASALYNDLKQAVDGLFAILFGYAITGQNPEIAKTYEKLQVFVKAYR